MLNAIALTFASGAPYFAGLVLVHVGILWGPASTTRMTRMLLNTGCILGLVCVILSAAPQPTWLYVAWGGIAVVTWIRAFIRPAFLRAGIVAASFCALAIMFIGEVRYWWQPSLSVSGDRDIYVVGDSISIGADAQELNWPERLGDKLDITVHNYSFGGAKVQSALQNAKRIQNSQAVVILEIGGNDVLAGTNTDEFRADLFELLETVCTSERDVIMFELPLPPFHAGYGLAQRTLADEFGVILIPKRVFTQVLAARGATVDGLHLSHTGHEIMASRLKRLFTRSP